jgi:enolase
MLIKEVSARIIKDSRGEKTIEVSVNNAPAASSPSGKSTGKYETKPYYKDLKFCVDFLNNWDEMLQVRTFDDLILVEDFIKKKLKIKQARLFGGNALFAFESAILKALAEDEGKELWQVVNSRAKKFPRPVGNAIGGGLHTKAKVKPAFQEFLLVPHEKTFKANVEMMQMVYRSIGTQIGAKDINDEGAHIAELNDEEALKILSEYSKQIDMGTDMAASSFYEKNIYDYGNVDRTRPAQSEHVWKLVKDYGVFYVEDPMQEEDFSGFANVKKNCRESMVVGDDLTATHMDRLQRAIKERSISGMIVKPNQNGSLLEVRDIMEFCKKHKIKTVMSHRSGETMDNALADYAFAFGADFIKCGVATPWRECKLKRMIEIESSL